MIGRAFCWLGLHAWAWAGTIYPWGEVTFRWDCRRCGRIFWGGEEYR